MSNENNVRTNHGMNIPALDYIFRALTIVNLNPSLGILIIKLLLGANIENRNQEVRNC
jgi:hypothetical protein